MGPTLEARLYTLKKAGLSYKKLEDSGVISPVISVDCVYKDMAFYDDEILIETSIEKYNGVKLFLIYTIKNGNTGKVIGIGQSGHCFLNSSGGIINLNKKYPEFGAILTDLSQN